MLVGDSKALQWISALDTIGAREGWKVRTLTKSSCSFTDAVITQKGKPYDSCTAWNREALAKLLADPPDIVVTSQASGAALVDPGEPARGTSRAAMAAGLRSRWITLTDAGIGVAVVRDNPTPPASLRPVYECVDEHRDNLSACMFTRAESETTGGSTAQLAAAKDLPGVHVVDLNDYLCPGNTCPPVIGNVLVYRQGAHITRSYVNTLHPQLRLKLLPVVLEATARGGG